MRIKIGRLGADITKSPVVVDWKAYYKNFELIHGEPVLYEGRLLFRDGWRYSSTDYAGPEWPPTESEKELHRLKLIYWTKRRELVAVERSILEHHRNAIRQLQSAKSLPLVRSVRKLDEGTGRYSLEKEEIDAEMFRGRLDWLEADIKECDESLKELELEGLNASDER